MLHPLRHWDGPALDIESLQKFGHLPLPGLVRPSAHPAQDGLRADPQQVRPLEQACPVDRQRDRDPESRKRSGRILPLARPDGARHPGDHGSCRRLAEQVPLEHQVREARVTSARRDPVDLNPSSPVGKADTMKLSPQLAIADRPEMESLIGERNFLDVGTGAVENDVAKPSPL